MLKSWTLISAGNLSSFVLTSRERNYSNYSRNRNISFPVEFLYGNHPNIYVACAAIFNSKGFLRLLESFYFSWILSLTMKFLFIRWNFINRNFIDDKIN